MTEIHTLKNVVHLAVGMTSSGPIFDRSLSRNFRYITDRFFSTTDANQLALLILPTEETYTTCFYANSESSDDKQLAALLQENLPDYIGVEMGDLYFHPLSVGHAVADRALVPQDYAPVVHSLEESTADNNQITSAVQLLVHDDSTADQYQLTLRILCLGPRPEMTPAEIGNSISDSIPTPYPHPIRSSRKHLTHWPVTHQHEQQYVTPLSLDHWNWHDMAVVDQRSFIGWPEVWGFITAQSLADRYSHIDYSATIPADRSCIGDWLDVFPLAETSLDQIDHIDSPWLDRTEIYREPTAMDTTLLSSPPSWYKNKTIRHDYPVFASWLLPADAGAMNVPSRIDKPHFTDLSPKYQGNVVLFDINADLDDVPIGSLGGLVSVCNRTAQQNHTWIITHDPQSARYATQVIRHPYRSTTDIWGIPYRIPRLTTIDNCAPLTHPDTTVQWQFSAGKQWRLLADNDQIANGTLPIGDVTELGLRYLDLSSDDVSDSKHQFNDADLVDQVIPQPAIPAKPIFVDQATVLYIDSSRVRRWTQPPTWADSKWLTTQCPVDAAVAEFADRYLVPRTDRFLLPHGLQTVMKHYLFDINSMYRPDVSLKTADSKLKRTTQTTTSWPFPFDLLK